jgi:addiction module HigA family antidote
MDELGMTVTSTAKHLGVSRKHLSAFVNGHVPCSSDMAQRIAVATGTSMQGWLNMQTAYDVWEAEHHPREEITKITQFAV